MRKISLEQRISRLEKFLKSESRSKAKKFEGFESDLNEAGARAAADRIAKQFASMVGIKVKPIRSKDVIVSPVYGWLKLSDREEIEDDVDARFAFQYGLADEDYCIEVYPTDNAINLIDGDGVSINPAGRQVYSDYADIIAFPIGDWAGFDLSMVHDDEDEWEDEDDMDESCNRRRTESRKSTQKLRNEDVKRLPNGVNADRVSDVLTGWAGTDWHRPQDAIGKLDREGILEDATNRWYPTVTDVAEAIELCWDDPIGAVGKGAARFFMGNIGGKMKCSLTLFPVTGGDSRARNLVLKFDWPMPIDEM